jgi:ABC exporter DevB family membrane fusion protein
MNGRRTLTLAVALVATGWVGLHADNEAAIRREPQATPPGVIVALGRVEPRSEEIYVAAAMTGRIATVPVAEGQAVDAGAIVATLESGDLAARVLEAEAGVRVARAALDRTVNGATLAERDEAAAEVAEAEAALVQAARELERQEGLTTQKAGSRQERDRALSEYEIAIARLNRVRYRRETIDTPVRNDARAKAEADVALAEARLAVARALHEKSLVRSPIAGVVLRVLRRPGELVTDLADTPIAVVGDLSRLRVRAEIDEADIAGLRAGQSAYVTAEAFGDQRFPGTVSHVGWLAGRKAVRSEKPGERLDRRVLETLIDLQPTDVLPVGLRVDAFIVARDQ